MPKSLESNVARMSRRQLHTDSIFPCFRGAGGCSRRVTACRDRIRGRTERICSTRFGKKSFFSHTGQPRTGHSNAATLPTDASARHAAALINGRARSIRSSSRGLCNVSHRSLRRWTLSQNSGLFPKTRPRISAVAAVTFRRSLHNSLTCLRGTPIASASAN